MDYNISSERYQLRADYSIGNSIGRYNPSVNYKSPSDYHISSSSPAGYSAGRLSCIGDYSRGNC